MFSTVTRFFPNLILSNLAAKESPAIRQMLRLGEGGWKAKGGRMGDCNDGWTGGWKGGW